MAAGKDDMRAKKRTEGLGMKFNDIYISEGWSIKHMVEIGGNIQYMKYCTLLVRQLHRR